MLNYFRRTAQVAILTFVLSFGVLLMIGGFNVPVWSDSHHGYSFENSVHKSRILWYSGATHVHREYHNGGHGDATH